jgi:hypothetical protein
MILTNILSLRCAPQVLLDCVANLAHLGFPFGGDFAAHGIYVTNGAVRP